MALTFLLEVVSLFTRVEYFTRNITLVMYQEQKDEDVSRGPAKCCTLELATKLTLITVLVAVGLAGLVAAVYFSRPIWSWILFITGLLLFPSGFFVCIGFYVDVLKGRTILVYNGEWICFFLGPFFNMCFVVMMCCIYIGVTVEDFAWHKFGPCQYIVLAESFVLFTGSLVLWVVPCLVGIPPQERNTTNTEAV